MIAGSTQIEVVKLWRWRRWRGGGGGGGMN